MRTPFLGSAYSSRSRNLADQRCVNLFPEVVETKSGKDVAGFYNTPGLDLLLIAGSGPIRGLHPIGKTLYAVSGAQVYSINTSWSPHPIGSINTGGGPVSMIDNGSQLAIFDGVNGYLVSGGVLTTIAFPVSSPAIATFQDGFGLVSQAGSNNFYQSNLNDLLNWPALQFGQANASPDPIIAIADLHREVWVFKSTTAEVWDNLGLQNFAFQRNGSVMIELGCVAPFSIAKVGESLVWLTQNTQGQGMVAMSEGYAPRRISTFAIENTIQKYPTISDAIAYSYQQNGHIFYVLTFPTGNATWVYDLTVSTLMKEPIWHQRAAFSNGVFGRHQGNAFAAFNGKSVIGDFGSGNIYALNPDTLTDNGAQRKWLRSWRALPKPTDNPTRFSSLRIDMETGIGVPVAANNNPLCVLRWSDDGGHTWSNERYAPVGPQGATALRVMFRRLGSTRRNHGLDRIFELSSTDQFKPALIGAELEM